MKLKPNPEIGGDDAKVGGNVDIDEPLAGDLDPLGGDADGAKADSTDEESGRRGIGELPATLRNVLLTMAVTAARTLRHAGSFSWRGIRASLARWRVISLIVTVVTAIALACAVIFLQYRPNQQTSEVAAHAAIQAASEGTVALLSYSPETLDHDVAAGKSHLTGELLRYFTGFSQYFVAPSVRQQGIKASASVLHAAVADMHPSSAVVLLFVHQTTSSRDKPDPILSTNSVRVTLTKINGSWMIAKFEPE
jgi:Mce-associated membrane protein